MDLQLKDKTALVTGSTSGIGTAIAEALPAKVYPSSCMVATSRARNQSSRG
jgi:NAD(P)-dependent dehydrogenase (short-subunit alcohol dehydrogenase family)